MAVTEAVSVAVVAADPVLVPHGSLFEARPALSAAVARRYISERDIPELCQRMHALGGRLYGLMRR